MYLWVNGKYVGYGEDSKLEADFDLYFVPEAGTENVIAFWVLSNCDGTLWKARRLVSLSGVSRGAVVLFIPKTKSAWIIARNARPGQRI